MKRRRRKVAARRLPSVARIAKKHGHGIYGLLIGESCRSCLCEYADLRPCSSCRARAALDEYQTTFNEFVKRLRSDIDGSRESSETAKKATP